MPLCKLPKSRSKSPEIGMEIPQKKNISVFRTKWSPLFTILACFLQSDMVKSYLRFVFGQAQIKFLFKKRKTVNKWQAW